MTVHYIRGCGLTVGVVVDEWGRIVDAPDLVADFVGRSLRDLLTWMERFA